MKLSPTLLAFALVGSLAVLSLGAAPVPFIDINPANVVSGTPGPGEYQGFDETHSDAMIGYTFYLTEAITVSQVGWFDSGQDGLSRSFQVGLWRDLSGAKNWPFMSYYPSSLNSIQLLGDADSGINIPAGNESVLNGVWRVVNLPSPLTLQPGGYELAGLDTATTPDVIKYVAGSPSNPQVTIGAPVMNYATEPEGFHVADSFILLYGLELGPMLFQNIPEPSCIALVGLGIAAITISRLRGA